MKKTKLKLALLALITLLILYFILKDDFSNIMNTLLSSNKLYIILLVLAFFTGDVLKGISYALISKKINPKFKLKDGLLLTIKTNFFNGITPFSLGGQPFQLYSLKKYNNIDYISGADILFEDFYVYQIALMILTIIFIIVNKIFNLVPLNDIATKFLIVGFAINFIIAMILIFLPYIKDNNRGIEKLITNVLCGLKIVKENKTKFLNKVIKKTDLFKNQIKHVRQDPILVCKCVLLNIGKLLTIGLCAFLAIKSINDNVSLLVCLITIILVITMASFIPIPGASGGTEFCFVLLLSSFILNSDIMSALIIWRFATYYLPVIFGGIMFTIQDGNKI